MGNKKTKSKAKSSSKSNKIIYALLVLLILAVAVVLYFYLLKPEMDKRDSLRDKYVYQQELLEEKVDAVDEAKKKAQRVDPLKEMELKIPTSADLQGVMDDLDEVEYDSSTAITEIRINNYEKATQDALVNDVPFNSALTEAELLEPATTDAPVSALSKVEIPSNLKLLTLELSVSAYEAEDINSFIKKITALQRIYVVDYVKYTNPVVADGVITAKIQVTTFNVKQADEVKKEKVENDNTKKKNNDFEKAKEE